MEQAAWGLGRKDPSPEGGFLGLWGEAGARALKGVLFAVLLFLSLSAEKKRSGRFVLKWSIDPKAQ